MSALPFHAAPVAEVLRRLGTGRDGLDEREARTRLRRVGANSVRPWERRSRLALLGEQVANLPSALLIGSAAVSALLGELADTAALASVLGVNTTIGYTLQRRSEELLASWSRLEAGDVEVVRAGVARRIPAGALVPGDVFRVAAGDVVPADARVIEARRLHSDEAALTGESEPQAKRVEPVAPGAEVADRASMIFAGTTVAGGRGRAVVTATGARTEVAGVRRLLEQTRSPPTPLAVRLERLSRRVAALAMGGAGAMAAAGVARGRPLAEMLRGAVALGIAALPEGLPVVSTAALVHSMRRLAREGMVARRLSSAESLGGVTVICADKTGTLTRNEMRLDVIEAGTVRGQRVQVGAGEEVRARPDAPFSDRFTLLLAAALLNSDVEVRRGASARPELLGSSTERALVSAALAAGLDGERLRAAWPLRRLVERSEGVHFVVSVHRRVVDGAGGGAREVAFVKGAPEQVVELCARDFGGAPLDRRARRRALARSEELAAAGLRVLGVAWRERAPSSGDGPSDGLDGGFTWLGLLALRDPLREGAADAIQHAAHAGIRTIILTGDHLRTAEAIAREVGLRGLALDGARARELAASSDDPEARRTLARVVVLARVTPADKLAVIHALRAQGEVVAMVGDGVNDAPALRAADVGIALGRRSSDMARQVADVVMEGEDLRTILAAVGEGRIVQDNLRRAVRYLFATNLSELVLVLGAALVGARDPLTPLQLLWINLLTDTLPALALALEPGDPHVLDRPPARPDAPLLDARAERLVTRDGLWMAALGALAFAGGGPPLAFGALSGAQLAYTLRCRHGDAPMDADFLRLLGVALGMQAIALLTPVGRVIGLDATGRLLALAGFAGGFAACGATGQILQRAARSAQVITRRGNAEPARWEAPLLAPLRRQGGAVPGAAGAAVETAPAARPQAGDAPEVPPTAREVNA